MHLYALDENESLISVQDANKQQDYTCLECRSLVRCRKGFLRQPHFYHLQPNRTCRQSGKSLSHIHLQLHLQAKFPGAELEKRFSSIQRIADVVYETEKIIFEIQCSPITAREVMARNQDYQSLGYQVIWLLHDQVFNRKFLTAAEHFLQNSPHYFTNFNAQGERVIYDQWDRIEKGCRLTIFERRVLTVEALNLIKLQSHIRKETPQWMERRLHHWTHCFSGDHLDHVRLGNILLINNDQKTDKFTKPRGAWQKICHWICFPYRLWLHLMLEKLTR